MIRSLYKPKGETIMTNLKNAILDIRSFGAMKTENKELAFQIVAEASKEGFYFIAKKEGWNWVIIDAEEN